MKSAKLSSDITRQYHSSEVWDTVKYRGIQTLKCPLDLWIYQEIIFNVKPKIIIESGTWEGGSAEYLADICKLFELDTLVITIDIAPRRKVNHPMIKQLIGSSISPEILSTVRSLTDISGPRMVILDSDHSEAHVLSELHSYYSFVTTGSYLIVEDTNLDGPSIAVNKWLLEHSEFIRDIDCERHGITFNPGGYLKLLPKF